MILKFNESQSFLAAKSIVDNIKEICQDLIYEGIKYDFEPSNDNKVEKLGKYISEEDIENFSKYIYQKFYVAIIMYNSTAKKNKNLILDILNHLEIYIKSEGLNFYYSILPEQYRNRLTKTTIAEKGGSFYKNSFIKMKYVDESVIDKNPMVIKIVFEK